MEGGRDQEREVATEGETKRQREKGGERKRQREGD